MTEQFSYFDIWLTHFHCWTEIHHQTPEGQAEEMSLDLDTIVLLTVLWYNESNFLWVLENYSAN